MMLTTRRGICAMGVAATALASAPALGRAGRMRAIERWGLFEAVFAGPSAGNPFVDVVLTAAFSDGRSTVTVTGFYDGDGVYRIRFSPPRVGTWTYVTQSNVAALDGRTGRVDVAAPSVGNHGPVGVAYAFHFAYADGTPFWQIGTTSYAWSVQNDAMCAQTLKTLSGAPFNKIRMALFPNEGEPYLPQYPFVGTPHAWDTTRFDPAYYRRLEAHIAALGRMGIEADLILFHPYDKGRWGFDTMPAAADNRYVRYTAARLSAFRNVWWSMANEYDLMIDKNEADFDRLFLILREADPYGRLKSIHSWGRFYDNSKPWITHASIQSGAAVEDPERAMLLRDAWRKPVIFDEVKYEGTHTLRWAQLTGQQLVDRFWQGTVAGTYVGHSELFDDEDYRATKDCWLGTGGRLKGTSVPRLKFLRAVLQAAPARGLDPIDKWQDRRMAGVPGQYYLLYFGAETPKAWAFRLPKEPHNESLQDAMRFTVDILDTWDMTVTPVGGVFTLKKQGLYDFVDEAGRSISLPAKPGIALRIQKVA